MTTIANDLAEPILMPGGLFDAQTLIQYWDTFADYIVTFLYYRERHPGNPIRLSTTKIVVYPNEYSVVAAIKTIRKDDLNRWCAEYRQRPVASEYKRMEQSLIVVTENDELRAMFVLSWFNFSFETHPLGLILSTLHYRFFKQKNMEGNFRKVISASAKDWIDDLVNTLDGSSVSYSRYGIAESQTRYVVNLYGQKQIIIRYNLDDLTEKTPALQVLFTFTVQNQMIQTCDISISPRPDYNVQLPFIFTGQSTIQSILENRFQEWFRESVITPEGVYDDIEMFMDPPYIVSGAGSDKTLVAQADIGQAGRDVGLETLIAIWPKTSMKIAEALGLDGEFLTFNEYPEHRVIRCRLINKDGDDCEYVYYRGLRGGHYVFVLINNIPVRADKPIPKTHVPIVDGERKIVDALWEFADIVRTNKVADKMDKKRADLVLDQVVRFHPIYGRVNEGCVKTMVRQLMEPICDVMEGGVRIVEHYPMAWPPTDTSARIQVTYNTFNPGRPVESMTAIGMDIPDEDLKEGVDDVNNKFRNYLDTLTLDETVKPETMEISK